MIILGKKNKKANARDVVGVWWYSKEDTDRLKGVDSGLPSALGHEDESQRISLARAGPSGSPELEQGEEIERRRPCLLMDSLVLYTAD